MMKLSLRLTTLAIGLALVVILLGGWTRLNDAGLGCPDWPGCYGTWVLPDDHAELAEAHPHVLIDLRKGWIEMIHRYAAGTLGVLLMTLAVIGFRQRRESKYPVVLSSGLLLLVIAQGIFGMWTVTLKLLPVVVTLHLLGGLATLTLLVLLHQRLVRLQGRQKQSVAHPGVRMLLVALFIQLVLGGWTSTNYAGWACSDWLYCHRDQIVGLDFTTGLNPVMQVGPNYEGGLLPAEARSAIQITHRLGAVILVCVCLLVTLSLRSRPEAYRPLRVFWLLLWVQAGLGIANVVWMLPLGLAVAHHAGAVLLLLAGLHLNAKVRNCFEEVSHGYAVTD